MAHTRATVGSSLPTTSDKVGEGPTNFEDIKTDLVERWGVDHWINNSNTSTDGDYDGRHKQVTMKESSVAPTALADSGILYTKDNSGVTDLYYKDDSGSGNEYALTGSETFGGVFAKVTTLSGTTGTGSDTQISYPSGFSQSNTYVLSAKCDFGGTSVTVSLPDREGSSVCYIYFTSTKIVLVHSGSYLSRSYKIIIGQTS